MRSIYRDTRLKHAHNPTGELFNLLGRWLVRVGKRLKKYACALALLLAAASCTVEPIAPDTCPGGCDATINFYTQPDSNGYYHMELDWTGEYLPYFYVDVNATKTDPHWWYNDTSVAWAQFDSDTSWVIGDTLVVKQSYYSPFGNTTQQGFPLPVGYTELSLTQYKGIEVNIAQNTQIYFGNKDGEFSTRRYLGPFIPEMIGDTITVYMKVFWDAGDYSTVKDDYIRKFIVE